jgi:SAM-dependent methyltransferase
MKRQGLHRPTIEDMIELSGIETLHPGGLALTRRTAQVAEMEPGLKVLDVSSGRGTQAVWYAREFGVEVIGVDLSPQMVAAATGRARAAGLEARVRFETGDSQALGFETGTFDVVINECAVGIPDDSQAVLGEMVRVVRPGGRVVMHESVWQGEWRPQDKAELAERYGTTPLEAAEWVAMLERAGAVEIETECEPWSAPENFYKIRQDRDVAGPGQVLTWGERLRTIGRIFLKHGPSGLMTALRNEKVFYRTVLKGRLGYCLFWGRRPLEAA